MGHVHNRTKERVAFLKKTLSANPNLKFDETLKMVIAKFGPTSGEIVTRVRKQMGLTKKPGKYKRAAKVTLPEVRERMREIYQALPAKLPRLITDKVKGLTADMRNFGYSDLGISFSTGVPVVRVRLEQEGEYRI